MQLKTLHKPTASIKFLSIGSSGHSRIKRFIYVRVLWQHVTEWVTLQALAQAVDRPSRPITGVRQPKLISYRDEVARRMHLLKAVKGIDPWQAEMSMLRGSPLLQKLRIPRVSTKVSKERSARLQELINFCATGGTTQTGRFRPGAFPCSTLNCPGYRLHYLYRNAKYLIFLPVTSEKSYDDYFKWKLLSSHRNRPCFQTICYGVHGIT